MIQRGRRPFHATLVHLDKPKKLQVDPLLQEMMKNYPVKDLVGPKDLIIGMHVLFMTSTRHPCLQPMP